MVSHRRLQAVVEAALAESTASAQEVFHMLHLCRPDFESFLQYPEPKQTDRAQVLSKEVRLPDAPPTILDDQDIQIALKLSDDFHLNEIDCVSLLVAGHQEWSYLGREPLECLRLSAGLWFTERRALMDSLQLIIRAVVLDEGLDPDLVTDLRQYVESIIAAGLRKRLLLLIKELNREDPSGLGGPGVEPYVIDSRGALVQRREIAQRERLSICQCLVFTCLIVRINAQEAKEIYGLLKDCCADAGLFQDDVKLQITYTITFSLLVSLISEALGGTHDMGSVLSSDSVFRRDFHNQVMDAGSETIGKGFTEVVRLAWAVFLMVNADGSTSVPASDATNARACLDQACGQDVFQFLTVKVLRTPSFQNDDADLLFVYNAYLHKMFMIFLSNPLGREKIKELKDTAMMALDSYPVDERDISMDDEIRSRRLAMQAQATPFISLLELIAGIYQKEPELVADNEVLWNFVRFIGEDHTSYLTLVAFLNMLTALACSEEGARKVYQLLQNRTFRTVSWQTLFSSLNVYEEHFRQCVQTRGSLLPPLQEGDAKALEAYALLLKKVVEAGNDVEKTMWFPDIEPLFKLLPFENVPPYLKGAFRNAIAAFVPVSPIVRDKVWGLLEAYDLPLTAAPSSGSNLQQVYDMAFELNEVEARQEEYPSTISYLNLLNVLILNESDTADKGRRYAGIFKFVRDQVLAPYAQRAYADPGDKWKMVVAALRHIRMLLKMYHVSQEDIDNSVDQAMESGFGSTKTSLPTLEIMKDLMSGKAIFRSIMSIIMLGVNFVMEERTSRTYGPQLEEAVQLSLELLSTAFQKDILYADHWRPIYQPIDVLMSHDSRQVITLIEYIRYEYSTVIQQHAIKIMDVLSSRMAHLVPTIIDAGVATALVEDYAACLEVRSQELQPVANDNEDTGTSILRLLLSNLNRPAPNVAHLLLKFDLDQPVERSTLQPKRYYSCLRVILDVLESRLRPQLNASLHELGLQLIYELCVDEITSGPTMELMRAEKYDFFSGHLSLACKALPKRDVDQTYRISDLQQRAWLLKLLALELHASDMDVMIHRRSCRRLIGQLFMHETIDPDAIPTSNTVPLLLTNTPSEGLQKIKVLELLDIVQYPLSESSADYPQELEVLKDELKVDDILNNQATVDAGGVYTISERGDRIIDLTAFRDKLCLSYRKLELQYNLPANERRQAALRDAVQKILRWAWKRNRFLEEQAAQLHMLIGWSQLVEISLSRRFEFLGNRLQVLFDILDATLDASVSPTSSLRITYVLSQVVLTTMAKLQEQSFSSSGEGEYSDDVTYTDLLSSVRISNSACHTILSKLLSAILRHESSEALRRRQYATLLSYFHYCQGMLNSDISLSVMRGLFVEGQDGEEDPEIEKLERDQAELAQLNFSILKQDVTAFIDLVAKDAIHGSEIGKAFAFYVLEALLGIDRNQIFFSQLQSRGLLQNCFSDVSTNSYQALVLPSRDMVRRLYTLEAELALLLRVCFYNKKKGAQALFAMGTIQHLSACKAIDVQLMDDAKNDRPYNAGMGLPSQLDRQHQIVIPVLRLMLCFTTLLDTSEKGRDEVALEILEFIKLHHGLFERVLRDDTPRIHLGDLEELQLVTAILSKVWPLEESEEFGFKQAMFNLAYIYFTPDSHSRNRYILAKGGLQNSDFVPEDLKKMELLVTRVRANLILYLHSLVSKQGLRLHLSKPDNADAPHGHYTLGRQRQPTLKLVSGLLEQAATDLETSVEERILIMAKLQDINELSRHEVDEIAKSYGTSDMALKPVTESDSMRKRRYLAMIEMCSAAGVRENQIACLLLIVEQALEILYLHVEAVQAASQAMDMDSIQGRKAELDALGQKLLPTFAKLESLKEEKVARSIKHIHRLVYSLRSQTLRALA